MVPLPPKAVMNSSYGHGATPSKAVMNSSDGHGMDSRYQIKTTFLHGATFSKRALSSSYLQSPHNNIIVVKN